MFIQEPGLAILQLSDLHFGRYQSQNNSGQTIETLWRGIKTFIGKELKSLNKSRPDLIVITGDIGSTGNYEEDYKAASEFIRNELLTNYIDIGDLIIVPGNHDLQWATDNESSTHSKRFQDYHKFLKDLYTSMGKKSDDFGIPSNYKEFLKNPHICRKFPKIGTTVLGLNSCLYNTHESEKKKEDDWTLGKFNKKNRNYTNINTDSLEQFINDNISLEELFNSKFNIILLHHHLKSQDRPVSPTSILGLSSSKYANVQQTNQLLDILENNEFYIIMHGHLHLGFHEKKDKFHIISAGSYGVKEEERDTKNAVNLVKIGKESFNFLNMNLNVICVKPIYINFDAKKSKESPDQPTIDKSKEYICYPYEAKMSIIESIRKSNEEAGEAIRKQDFKKLKNVIVGVKLDIKQGDIIGLDKHLNSLNAVNQKYNLGISFPEIRILSKAREKILVESSLKNVNEVFVGRRPTMNYVRATMMILNKGKEVTVKARGRAISHAVEVCEVLKNRFLKGTEYKEIEISTDQLEGEDGRSSNISSIKIVLAPPE